MIKKGSKVALMYRLTYTNPDGELIEEATKNDPLKYVHGNGEMLEAFEEKIQGKSVTETFQFTLSPEQAYGAFQETLLVEYPKEQFLVEGEVDEDFLQEGELIEMTDEEGNIFEGLIEKNKNQVKK